MSTFSRVILGCVNRAESVKTSSRADVGPYESDGVGACAFIHFMGWKFGRDKEELTASPMRATLPFTYEESGLRALTGYVGVELCPGLNAFTGRS